MKYRITFVKEGKTYEAEEGMTVLEAEIAAGLKPDAPCGGSGKCKKILAGEAEKRNAERRMR